MRSANSILLLIAGVGLGVIGMVLHQGQAPTLNAYSNDRYNDYLMATGPVAINARTETDGVWMIDHSTGKLLGTVIDKSTGKIVGWAEVDLAQEFGLMQTINNQIVVRQDVHFMMVAGYITKGQAALYVAETTTGRFGVYTMAAGANGTTVAIRRHDLTTFRRGEQPIVPAANENIPQPGFPGLPPIGAVMDEPKR